MRDRGWTCLPALVHPEALEELRELRDEDMVAPEERRRRMADSKIHGGIKQPFLRSSALARLAVDPTVMYVCCDRCDVGVPVLLPVSKHLITSRTRTCIAHNCACCMVSAVPAQQCRSSRSYTFDSDCASCGSRKLPRPSGVALRLPVFNSGPIFTPHPLRKCRQSILRTELQKLLLANTHLAGIFGALVVTRYRSQKAS